MKYTLLFSLFYSVILHSQCNIKTNVQYYDRSTLDFSTPRNVLVTFGFGNELSNLYSYYSTEADAVYCVVNSGFSKKYVIKLDKIDIYNPEITCSSIKNLFNYRYLNGKDQNGGIWKIHKPRFSETNSNVRNYPPRRSFEQPTSSINHSAISRNLSIMQNRIDNLSSEEKEKIQAYNTYKNKKNNANRVYNVNSKYFSKKMSKDFKTRNSDSKKYIKDTRDKKKYNINNLSNGWYSVYLESYTNSGVRLLQKRIIEVFNGRVIRYLGKYNMSFDVMSLKNKGSGIFEIELKIPYDSSDNPKFNIFSVSDKQVISPKIEEPVKIMFYTSLNNQDKIDVFVKGNNIHEWDEFSGTNGTSINCSQKHGVYSLFLPPGEYEYTAVSSLSVWKNQFSLHESNGCVKKRLIN